MNDNKKHFAIENPEDVCFNCLKETKINKIHIGEMGYGSYFDGWSTRINLCDDCMKLTNEEWWKLEEVKTSEYEEEYKYENEISEFVNKMPVEGKELFQNRYSTDNYFMEPQDWIDYELDILPHEKCKEYGMYSPQEIKAYETRFPICGHPVNRIFKDGSVCCWCPFGASGDKDQKCSPNTSEKCYGCKYFVKREVSIKDVLNEDWEDYEAYIKTIVNLDKYNKKFGNPYK